MNITNQEEKNLSEQAFRENVVIDEETGALIAKPACYPIDLTNKLKQYFITMPDIYKAYLVIYYKPEFGENVHTLVAIDMRGNWGKISTEIEMVAETAKVIDLPVDIMQVRNESGFSKNVAQENYLFYKRK